MHLVFERYVKDPPCLAAAANNPLAWKFDCDEQGTKGEWVRCNYSAALDSYVGTTVEYHLLLARKGYHGLVYKSVVWILGYSSIAECILYANKFPICSGDHDMLEPYITNLKWIYSLNLTLDDNWRPWKANGKVAG